MTRASPPAPRDPGPARDAGRSRVYAAEQSLHRLLDAADATGVRTVHLLGSSLELPVERRFASIASVQAYVDRVLALNWVRASWAAAERPVRVRARRGQDRAEYFAVLAEIAVPLHRTANGVSTAWALRELVVLHELAHHLGGGGHGRPFRDCFLTLVTELVGPEAGLVLRAAFADQGLLGRSAGFTTPARSRHPRQARKRLTPAAGPPPDDQGRAAAARPG